MHETNHSQISVHFIGIVKISTHLILEDVLYVPYFKFNLISVRSLTRKNDVSINFFNHACIIQDVRHLRMIG